MPREMGGGEATAPLRMLLGSRKCPKGHLTCQTNVRNIYGTYPKSVKTVSNNVPKVSEEYPKHVREISEKCPNMCPKHTPNSSKISKTYDKKSLPAVPGIEPGTLRIRLRGRIRVPAHWANPAPRQRVSRAFLCIRIRQKHAPQLSCGRNGVWSFRSEGSPLIGSPTPGQ